MRTPIFLTLISTLMFLSPAAWAQDVQKGKPLPDDGGEVHKDGQSLDKEYYEYYFKTLPNTDTLEKEKLEYNLIRSLKLELRKRDAEKMNPEELKKVNASSVRYERVFEDSIWMRGIRKQLGHLKFKDYMFVIVYDKYYCFISYEMNPARYIQEPYQVQLIFKKENPFTSTLPQP
ncbi:hypothetical protein EHQ53_14530 [Leptospira langatensis]|uniref:Uncharacterized protein n=1 Tax=Leptospira langatensis TaxID=2484983 RepID=A0A5F1ZRD6_9LEPT|nr:hypothetical protein [Leptospira langatensis]TGK01952.1 hypothetical protein EHO57_09180 [Leptospira langatensis]TGL39308.1 hypothetical protein EHQ53_14530 [Leptospira langatensis]